MTYSNSILLKWKSLFVPRICANPNEIAFIAKLAIHQEEEHQYNSLQNLIQSNSIVHFYGRFHKVKGENDMYAVELVSSGKESMQETQTRQSPPGTHLVIRVDMDTLFELKEKHLLDMRGAVVTNVFNGWESKADFAAVVTGPQKKGLKWSPKKP